MLITTQQPEKLVNDDTPKYIDFSEDLMKS